MAARQRIVCRREVPLAHVAECEGRGRPIGDACASIACLGLFRRRENRMDAAGGWRDSDSHLFYEGAEWNVGVGSWEHGCGLAMGVQTATGMETPAALAGAGVLHDGEFFQMRSQMVDRQAGRLAAECLLPRPKATAERETESHVQRAVAYA